MKTCLSRLAATKTEGLWLQSAYHPVLAKACQPALAPSRWLMMIDCRNYQHL
jgi:hypothetical protein